MRLMSRVRRVKNWCIICSCCYLQKYIGCGSKFAQFKLSSMRYTVLPYFFSNLDSFSTLFNVGWTTFNLNRSHLGICWFHGSSFKGFLLFFLFSDWLKSNHLRSRIERGFSDIFHAIFLVM